MRPFRARGRSGGEPSIDLATPGQHLGHERATECLEPQPESGGEQRSGKNLASREPRRGEQAERRGEQHQIDHRGGDEAQHLGDSRPHTARGHEPDRQGREHVDGTDRQEDQETPQPRVDKAGPLHCRDGPDPIERRADRQRHAETGPECAEPGSQALDDAVASCPDDRVSPRASRDIAAPLGASAG